MKKNDKFLRWTLKELPTAEGVAALVEQKVITAEEAREMLFTEAVDITSTATATANFTGLPTYASTSGN